MFGGNNANRLNNQNNSGVSINTRVKTFNSETSSLAVSFWNQNYSLTISPAIGPDGNGVLQYDQNRQGKTALTIDACEALLEEFRSKILPVYKNIVEGNETCPDVISVTIETGKDPKRNVVGFEMTPASDGGNIPDVYFVLYGMVDGNNIASPANTYKHKFAKRAVHINYNPNTGISNIDSYANADLNMFVNMISRNELLLPFSDHVSKYNSERAKSYATQSNGSSYGSNYGSNNNQQNFASSPAYNANGYSGVFPGALNLGGAEELPFN